MENDWKTYHQQTKDRAPSSLLKEAIQFVKNKNIALDLGAGALVESNYLLSEGFKAVTAVDIVPFEEITNSSFTFKQASFEEYKFPENTYNLVNAQFSLPFNSPESFSAVWNKMRKSLVVGGVFSGQLFGFHDTWSGDPSMTFHSKEQVEDLLKGTQILKLEEIEKDALTSNGDKKHWHIFAIIFEKIDL